jgi:sulfite reductase beta subunit-like hemoprotein
MAAVVEETLSHREAFENQHDQTVRQEIEIFRQKAEAFLAGDIPDDEFRPFRLKHGIYGQRQQGVQMVRVKIPGGLATARQFEQFADIADEFAGGKGHITTRQNVQYHFVPLAKTADLMHRLQDAALTVREACYNTVRNITTCVWSGVARDEVFDVRPYAQKLAYAMLRQNLTQNLPRKFKIAFDGCQHKDCIAGTINDLGIRAVLRDGQRGFRIVVGGGLGPLPVEAQLLDEFLPEERLVNRVEAVIRVFNLHGNRKNRNTARIKFLVRDRGFAWVKEQVEKEYAEILANGGIAWPELIPEGFGGYQSNPQPLGNGALLPVVNASKSGDAEFDAWLATNVVEQRQT